MKNNSEVYDVVIIGNYTKDTIVSPSGKRQVDGGGFNYGAHAAALMGLNVAAVTRLAQEDFFVVEALQNIGVTVYPEVTPKSTHMLLYYPTTDVDNRTLTVTSTAGSFTPEQVKNLNAKAILINASTRKEVGLDVIEELRKKNSILVADVQSFVRVIAEDGTLCYEEWPEMKEVLSKIDILKTDAVEAEFLTGEKDKNKAAKILAGFGPKEVVLTHREGLIVWDGMNFFEANFLPKKLIGRSGRGDTCIASYAAKRLTASPDKATVWAAAVTSLKMEAEGPILRNIADVEQLIETGYNSEIRPD